METDTDFEFNTQKDMEDRRESAVSMECTEDTGSGGGGIADIESEQEKKVECCCVHSSPESNLAGQTHTKKCKLNHEFHCGDTHVLVQSPSTSSICETDDGRRRKQKATNVLVGTVPVMDEQRKEKEFFKPLLQQSPKKGETW